MGQPITYESITRRERPCRPSEQVFGTRFPEEIPSRLPHLTLAQVYASLTYHNDHWEEVDGYIARNRIPDSLTGTMVSGQEMTEARREGWEPRGQSLNLE